MHTVMSQCRDNAHSDITTQKKCLPVSNSAQRAEIIFRLGLLGDVVLQLGSHRLATVAIQYRIWCSRDSDPIPLPQCWHVTRPPSRLWAIVHRLILIITTICTQQASAASLHPLSITKFPNDKQVPASHSS